MSLKFKKKVALVTGASKGIGASIAEHLAAEGASVVVNYATSKEGADRIVAKIVDNGGKATAVQANVTNPADIQRLIAETIKTYGTLDILVNNAGIYEFAAIEEITSEHFHKMFNLNVLALILVTQEAVKYFNPGGGTIINISSIASVLALPSASVYSATKAAVDAVTKSLSKELGQRNIRIHAVNPGLIETEGTHTVGLIEGDFRNEIVAKTPLSRIGQPHDVARAVVFLASDDASWITGETLQISGGLQ